MSGEVTDEQAEQLRLMAEAFEPEPLHGALAAYLTPAEATASGWPALRHPLVYMIPFLPQHSKTANAALARKHAALVKAAEEGDWQAWIWLHERPWRFTAFAQIADGLDDETYWLLLSDVWIDSENLHQVGDRVLRSLLEIPERGASTQMMTEAERAAFDALPEQVVVYRGWNGGGTRHGWSWSLDRERAEWFARRFAPPEGGKIIEATVPRSAILALFTRRSENEVVIDPAPLRRHAWRSSIEPVEREA